MIPYLFHIGPFYFNMYGFWIAIGLLLFMWAAGSDRLAKKYLKPGQLINIVFFCLIIGIIGGRILSIIQEFDKYTSLYDVMAFWEPGYSLFGSVIAITLTLPLYLQRKKIKILPVLDLAGIYAPLLQSVSRIGCFFAGCCYGCPSHIPWAVTYTHPDSIAALNIPCHPTQLYSTVSLFILFIIIRFVLRPFFKKPGQLFSLYLIGSSIERFFNDFLRAEHYETDLAVDMFSSSQLIALCLLGVGLLSLYLTISVKIKP